MAAYGLLDPNEEDNLHALRLLNFEEKPFRRLTKRLLSSGSLIIAPQNLPPTPPPDSSFADEEAAAREIEIAKLEAQRNQWRDEVLFDFAAYESNIVRVQFLLNSNERERERYASEKVGILQTAQSVRENNMQLHDQLADAQRTLEMRKTYDTLAEKITGNRMLRPRDDQRVQLDKLNAEIAELEREGADYSRTWVERREQFGRIVDEGMQMLRMIRDEKEEAERKGDMEDMEDGSEDETSKAGTPRPMGGMATPAHISQDGELGSGFHPSASQAQSLGLTAITARSSRAGSPVFQQTRNNVDEVQMTDGEDLPPTINQEDDADIEEGEATEQGDHSIEKMDTT